MNFDIEKNYLLKGNNLKVMKKLLPYYEGKVKLIYIDPPYNTGNDGFKYNDAFNHSTWLVFMKNRLEVAKTLLADDGVIFVQIDDNEQAYLKVLMDEVFGRENFVCNVIWNHRKSSQNDIDFSLSHNHTLVFSKKRSKFRLNTLPIDVSKFSNPDNDPRGDWVADPFDAPNIRPNLTYPITNPNTGIQHLPPSGRHWRFSQDKFSNALKDGRILFGKTGNSKPQYKRYKFEAEEKGENPSTIWSDIDTATNATQHLMEMFGDKVFSTPKPEALLERIIQIATKEGDLVLDFFAGSGTTAAVAHKMGRRWIAIEQMDYVETITRVRLQKVLEGEQGGVSKNHKWQGGGGFEYINLK